MFIFYSLILCYLSLLVFNKKNFPSWINKGILNLIDKSVCAGRGKCRLSTNGKSRCQLGGRDLEAAGLTAHCAQTT